jgi:hypothetical protein
VRSRSLRIALLFYTFFWFGIVVPGHKRGVVTLDASGHASCECAACQADNSKTNHPTDPASRCAICDFTAHLILPPVYDFTLPPMGLADRVPTPVVEDRVARVVLTPFDGRGPPHFS